MQPTAMSASAPIRSTGTAPAEWHRSHCDQGAGLVGGGGQRRPGRTSRRTGSRRGSARAARRRSSSAAAGSAGSHQRSSRPSVPGDAGGDVPVGGEGRRLRAPITRRPGRSRTAATSVLNRVTRGRVADVHVAGRRPRSAARSGRRPAGSGRPSRRCSTTRSGRCPTRRRPPRLHPVGDGRGSAPSELPSR